MRFFKTKIAILILITLCGCKQKNTTTSDLAEENLYGSIKSIDETTYDTNEVQNENDDANIKDRVSFEYNEAGFLTKEVKYNADGTESMFLTKKYDFDNILRSSELKYANDKHPIKHYYFYDINGLRIRESDSVLDLEKGFTNYIYDEKGKLKEVVEYNDGQIDFRKIYQNSYTTLTERYIDGKLYQKGLLVFDSLGHIIKNTQKRDIDAFQMIITTKYDQNYDPIEVNWIDNDTSYNREFFSKYDTFRNLIEERVYANGIFSHKTTYKYHYDSNKNWIKKVARSNDKIISITTRVISYWQNTSH